VKDLTVVAIPFYFASMGVEYLWLKGKDDPTLAPGVPGRPARDLSAGVYERSDTFTSLAMGVGSLVAPLVAPKLLRPFTPGTGRYGRVLVSVCATAAAVTTIADLVARRARPDDTGDGAPDAPNRDGRRRIGRLARRVAGGAGVASIVTGGVAVASAWSSTMTINRMWARRVVRDLGTGPLAVVAAISGWDFIYYWNHRLMHECRAMWAIHVVHHSSERYNLSTALRQPVADSLGAFVPYSLLALVGIRPELIGTARGVNLLYQFWIHTETIDRMGPGEELLNTPSHHRVHHGSNSQYLDRNHGSILIVWDRLFGTFEREQEPVVYGLTKNVGTFNPLRVAAHEHYEMFKDVAASTNWTDRLSFVLRGPGWSGRRRAEMLGASEASSPVTHTGSVA
jgi:sterol desaturase/sphingolipid hydroxylase (fatty acid hydroxylase superfamily)